MLAASLAVAVLLASAATPRDRSEPFRYVKHEIVVAARINGPHLYHFLLDTDTTPSAIDQAVVRRLHIRPTGRSGGGQGVGSGKILVTPVRIPTMRVGDLHVYSLEALQADLSPLSATLGVHVDGVLGTSLLKGRIIRINYGCRRLEFLSAPPEGAPTAHFSGSSDNISRDVGVGARAATATFDTGNGSVLLVTRHGIQTLHLQSDALGGSRTTVYGYKGPARQARGAIEKLRIGDIYVGNTEATFGQSGDEPYDIDIGNRILERFTLTMDYRTGSLWLQHKTSCAP